MRTHEFETDNGSYVVHVDGDEVRGRPTLVFLHGPGLNAAAERRILAPALSGRARCVWFDQLGCGESRVRDPSLLTWDHNVDDVAHVAEHFTDTPAVFVGHSAGAKGVDEMVRRWPSLVAGAVWISPADRIGAVVKSVVAQSLHRKNGADGLTVDQREGLHRLASVPDEEFGRDETMLFLQAFVPLGMLELYWSDQSAQAAFLAASAGSPLAGDAFVALYSDYFARGEQAVPDYAKAPLSILYSSDDRVTPWEQHGANLAKAVPDASVRMIENGGHFLHLQRPRETADAIITFLQTEF